MRRISEFLLTRGWVTLEAGDTHLCLHIEPNDMVRGSRRLLTLFAECGVILSSHRDERTPGAWAEYDVATQSARMWVFFSPEQFRVPPFTSSFKQPPYLQP